MAEMKNQKLLNKALSLLPDLIETKADVARTVEIYKNDNNILRKIGKLCRSYGLWR